MTLSSAEKLNSRPDFGKSPFLLLWELTRACSLACRHCRARAQRFRNEQELSGVQLEILFDQIEELSCRLLVLTGGDPFERPDLIEIVQEAKRRSLKVALTPSATPLVTKQALALLSKAGLDRLAISLDGDSDQSHDDFRRIKGSYEMTLKIINWARELAIPIQINTSVSKYNSQIFDQIYLKVKELDIVLWSIFFLVPTGRANSRMQIDACQAEQIMKRMAQMAANDSFDIKATAAPHFRRVLLETVFDSQDKGQADLSNLHPFMKLGSLRSYQSVNDGNGIAFISHTGQVFPSGFLPVPAGDLRKESLRDIYGKSELFCQLRDPLLLKGKCGRCRYKFICGGSRARAFAETGDYLASDSLCSYDERAFPES